MSACAQVCGGPSRCWVVTGVTGSGLAWASPAVFCGGGKDSCPILPFGQGAPSSQSLQLQAMGLPEISSVFHGQGKGRAHQQEGDLQEIGRQIRWEKGGTVGARRRTRVPQEGRALSWACQATRQVSVRGRYTTLIKSNP